MIRFTAGMLALLLSVNHSWAVEPVMVGKETAEGQSIDNVSHASWNVLLARYVNDDGQVDYRKWKSNPADVSLLDSYLSQLSAGDPKMAATRESKLAFWINAYNAVTIRGILREYPTTSIRNHTARLWGYNIWKHLLLHVGNRTYSLDQIEHDVLRKMDEPRIHFAIVCASKSCPRLLNQAYSREEVDQQLENNSKDFFRRAENFRFDRATKDFRLSAILDWFGEDFGKNQVEQLKTIAAWLPNEDASNAARSNAVTVRYLDYDWTLNEP